MGGGLMQLVAYGAQDIYLTGNPQITFFKVVYRRHTNFSMECIQQNFSGNWTANGGNITATIARNGDLVGNMHVECLLPAQPNVVFAGAGAAVLTNNHYAVYCNSTGHALIDEAELEIGGQKIDKHYGHWLDVWREMTDHNDNEARMVNFQQGFSNYTLSTINNGTQANLNELRVYVPLKFWFNRNPGLALPLIALQYHEVKIKLRLRAINTLINFNRVAGTAFAPPGFNAGQLWVDYIYLDTDERRRFAQQSHEYLIEQLQYKEAQPSTTVNLTFNHPVKALYWTVNDIGANIPTAATAVVGEAVSLDPLARQLSNRGNGAAGAATPAPTKVNANVRGNDYFSYDLVTDVNSQANINRVGTTSAQFDQFATMKLTLNGHDRFAARRAPYFRTVQPVQSGHRAPRKAIYMYSFALKPEEHQPSGTCNFSRIDTARMVFTTPNTNNAMLNIYAVNYNVLRIMSGMGGLAYSN